jgi:nitrogen regulatory protein PII-like uncharacterized protein
MTSHPSTRDCEDLYVYSEEDLADIASDMYVDIRDVVDDEDAAAVTEIIFDRLTDEHYTHTDD